MLPPVQRGPDGEMTGAQSIASFAALYDVAGQIRESFLALQEQAAIALQTQPKQTEQP